jgi:hypothetical protein
VNNSDSGAYEIEDPNESEETDYSSVQQEIILEPQPQRGETHQAPMDGSKNLYFLGSLD